MSSAVSPGIGGTAVDSSVVLTLGHQAGKLWWLWLVTGIAWVVAALVILQFDSASVTTIGIIVGCMFLAFGAQQLLLAAVAERLRWLWAIVGVVFLIAGVICFAPAADTFAALADILGFLLVRTSASGGGRGVSAAAREDGCGGLTCSARDPDVRPRVLDVRVSSSSRRRTASRRTPGLGADARVTDIVRAFRLRRASTTAGG